MNHVYPSAVTAALTGDLDVLTDSIKAELLEGYTYSDAHETIGDIPGGTRFGYVADLTVLSVDEGTVNVADFTFASVESGHTVNALVIYVTGSWLLTLHDRRGDTTALALETNDGDIAFSFPRGCFKL